MSILKIDAVHLIGGLSSAAACLSNVPNSSSSIKAVLAAIEKLATAISDSPATDAHLAAEATKKTS
jgi:hypothetical protein